MQLEQNRKKGEVVGANIRKKAVDQVIMELMGLYEELAFTLSGKENYKSV